MKSKLKTQQQKGTESENITWRSSIVKVAQQILIFGVESHTNLEWQKSLIQLILS